MLVEFKQKSQVTIKYFFQTKDSYRDSVWCQMEGLLASKFWNWIFSGTHRISLYRTDLFPDYLYVKRSRVLKDDSSVISTHLQPDVHFTAHLSFWAGVLGSFFAAYNIIDVKKCRYS